MSFIEYYRSTQLVPISQITSECVSLIVPLNSDSFLLLQTNNTYQVYRVLSGEVTFSGQLPKNFVASQFIEPLSNFKESCVFFTDSEGGICKLNYRENISEVRPLVMPEVPQKMNNISIQYRLLGEISDYLVGWIKNVENMSCTFFLYDWAGKTFFNCLHLGSNFFNLVISNLSHNINPTEHNSNLNKPLQINLAVASEDDKKIWYNHIQLSQKMPQQDQPKQSRIQFTLKQSGKKNMAYDHCPKVVHLSYPYLYMITNHKDGPFLLEVNLEENSRRRLEINSEGGKVRGLVRRYLGIVDNNILFIVHNIVNKIQEIYCVPVPALQNLSPMVSKVNIIKLIRVENDMKNGGDNKLGNIYKCVQGFSFHRYSFELEKLAKLCIKQSPEFIPNLIVETIYRIPKKYYYFQMSQQLHFPCALTHQILSLL